MKAMKAKRKTFTFDIALAEKLRKFAFVAKTSQSQIVRDALTFYFKTPKKGNVGEMQKDGAGK